MDMVFALCLAEDDDHKAMQQTACQKIVHYVTPHGSRVHPAVGHELSERVEFRQRALLGSMLVDRDPYR